MYNIKILHMLFVSLGLLYKIEFLLKSAFPRLGFTSLLSHPFSHVLLHILFLLLSLASGVPLFVLHRFSFSFLKSHQRSVSLAQYPLIIQIKLYLNGRNLWFQSTRARVCRRVSSIFCYRSSYRVSRYHFSLAKWSSVEMESRLKKKNYASNWSLFKFEDYSVGRNLLAGLIDSVSLQHLAQIFHSTHAHGRARTAKQTHYIFWWLRLIIYCRPITTVND